MTSSSPYQLEVKCQLITLLMMLNWITWWGSCLPDSFIIKYSFPLWLINILWGNILMSCGCSVPLLKFSSMILSSMIFAWIVMIMVENYDFKDSIIPSTLISQAFLCKEFFHSLLIAAPCSPPPPASFLNFTMDCLSSFAEYFNIIIASCFNALKFGQL